jgi:hypothetical protein
LSEVKILFLNGPSLACQTRIADAVKLPIGGSQVLIDALVLSGLANFQLVV